MLTFTSMEIITRGISEGYLDSRYIWAWAFGGEGEYYGLLRGDMHNGILDAVFTEQVGNTPSGPDGQSNDLGPSKMKLYKWSTVRPAFWTVQPYSGPSGLPVQSSLWASKAPSSTVPTIIY